VPLTDRLAIKVKGFRVALKFNSPEGELKN